MRSAEAASETRKDGISPHGRATKMTSKREQSELEPKTAEQYRQAADAHAQTLKDFWKRFLVSGLFVMAAIIIILASLAWFVSNNQVKAETATLSAKGDRFALTGVSGDDTHQGVYDNVAAFGTNDSMAVSATVNLNNYNGGEVGPGASGTIQFTVTPVATDLGNVQVSLERAVQLRTSDNSVGEVQKDGTLCDLFRGHILFFEKKDGEGVFPGKDASGYYSNPLISDVLTVVSSEFQDESGKTTKTVTRTLYWAWPSQLQAFVLTGNVNYYQNLFAPASDTTAFDSAGYATLQADINKNLGCYYAALDNQGRYFTPKMVPEVSPSMSSNNMDTCSLYYNYADEQLGSQVEYFQLRFSAQEVNN
ncbi:hypothetical protein ET524_08725 [Senegalimassilia faecalis]|uniref:Uncharacterized protein n=1 Tax=Senegalimassilia faecalis TaxID=2509433 RepID=A0A4Q2K4I5_9ACTN|nr:hypothetical protein [Senegalimassilia faecalis]RXZ54554.1 hypothetical protein ET524_08725 [Senegalimassilia faecalis]